VKIVVMAVMVSVARDAILMRGLEEGVRYVAVDVE
jgi:hypothetical protein